MTVRLSALSAGRPLPPRRFLVLISVRGWIDTRAIVRLEGLGLLKKIHFIWIRSRDLPACSIVPQPIILLRKKLSVFFWTDKWLICLPKYPVSFKVYTQLWTAFFIFRSGLTATGLAKVCCIPVECVWIVFSTQLSSPELAVQRSSELRIYSCLLCLWTEFSNSIVWAAP
jgi:hypothetical protein